MSDQKRLCHFQTKGVSRKRLYLGILDLPFSSFDTPANGATVWSSIAVTGWVLAERRTAERAGLRLAQIKATAGP
ncbi:MAG: hypothetical protein NTZ26_02535 [Candidatus Aminicenantes bacterium]|nr:hypothetical protein [Candidatus Aminicenantes bacterium]